jgi:hypothetical protein
MLQLGSNVCQKRESVKHQKKGLCANNREKSESKKKECFVPFCYYSPLGKVRIGCNWGFGFE